MSAQDYALTDIELKEMTGYSRPAYQLKTLKALGIPAKKRPDNTLLVMRMHCLTPVAQQAASGPKLKSARK